MCFDANLAIVASAPTITSTCATALNIITNSSGNKRETINFQYSGSNLFVVGTDVSSNNTNNFFVYDGLNAVFRFSITACGQILIGTSTCNSKMIQGVVISSPSMLGAQTGIPGFVIQSSDLAHGITGVGDSKDFLKIGAWGASGGTWIQSITACEMGMVLTGYVTTISTVRSVNATAPVRIDGLEKSGTGASTMGANRNVFIVADGSNTRFIFDSDGDLSADAAVTASAYDLYNDAALCRAFDLHVSDPATVIRNEFDNFIQYQPSDLERAKLVTFNPDGHHFWNVTQFVRLHNGAIGQLYTELRRMKHKLTELSPPTDKPELASTSGPPLPDS